jgi:antitoxin VapB
MKQSDKDMITVPPETEQLARLVATRSGTTPEQVLKQAVEAHAREVGVTPTDNRHPSGRPSLDRMMAISERFAAYAVLDRRSPDEIVGYDEFGVPH